MIPLLAMLPMAAIAQTCDDELEGALQPVSLLVGVLLIVATGIALYPFVPLWLHVSLLVILALVMLRASVIILFLTLAPLLGALHSSLTVMAALLGAGIGSGILLTASRKPKTWKEATIDAVKFAALPIAISLVLLV